MAVVIFKFSHTGIVVEGAAAEDRTVGGNYIVVPEIVL
jgi:hypothetical protein